MVRALETLRNGNRCPVRWCIRTAHMFMSARHRTAVAGGVIAASALLAASVGATAGSLAGSRATGERPRGVVESCATRSEARFPRAFANPRNLVVGPVVMVGAGGTANFVWSSTGKDGGNKFPLLVRAGHRVTVELSRRARRFAGLAYGPLPQGEVHLRSTHRVVAFVACGRGEDSGSSVDGRPVTFWSGGVVARSPRCVPLRVWVDGERSPRRAIIRFDMRRCA